MFILKHLPTPVNVQTALIFPVVFEQIRQPVGYKKAPGSGALSGEERTDDSLLI